MGEAKRRAEMSEQVEPVLFRDGGIAILCAIARMTELGTRSAHIVVGNSLLKVAQTA